MKKLLVLIIFIIPMFFITQNVYSTSPINNVEYVVDETGSRLSSSQISTLTSTVLEMKEEYDIDIHIVIASSVNEHIVSYSNRYISDIYGTTNVDAILIVLADYYIYSDGSTKRQIEISCYGDVDKLISSNDAYNLTGDAVYDYFVAYQYYNCLTQLLIDMDEEIASSILFNKILPHLIIGGIAIVVAAAVVVSSIFSRGGKKTISNYTYMDKNSAKILGRYDRYVRTTVTRTPKQSSSGGSGGGGGRSSGGGRGA